MSEKEKKSPFRKAVFDPTASNIDWKEIWIPSALAFYMAALLSVLFTGAGSDRTRGNKLKENRLN